jgi:tetratricopeptide (TPR) repeat protein
MAGISGGVAQRLAAAALAASLFGAAPLRLAAEEPALEPAPLEEAAPAPAAPRAAAVFSPRAPAALRSVDGGARLWVVQELRRGGIPVVDPVHTDAVAARHLKPDHLFLRGSDAKALAQETEAGSVLLTHIRVSDGQLELWLRAYDASGELLAVGHGSGRTAELGAALAAALPPVLRALGGEPGGPEPAPRLAELGNYERALEHLSAGALASAWREVEPIHTPTAAALRDDIAARSADVPGPERSRLASLRGASDPDWLIVRRALQKERTTAVLLAGAEKAAAAGDAKGALVLFAEAAKHDAANLDAARGRARALTALGDHEQAVAAFERVLELAPEDLEARLGLAASPAFPPAEQAKRWLAAGELQTERLDDDGARSSLEQAVALDANLRGAARRHVGRLEEALGNDADALVAYDEAAGLDAADLAAVAGSGRVRARTGDAPGAAAAFERVLTVRPADAEALAGYGESLLAQGKAEEALPKLQQAVELAPHEARARSSLARALTATGREQEALTVLDPKEVAPDERAQILSQSAAIHAAAGRLPEARVALEQAVVIEPDEAPLRSALAKVHTDAGDAEAAQREQALAATLTGAREIAPTDAAEQASAAAEVPRGGEFAALAATFPTATPDRVPIRRVAWLGVAPPSDWRGRLRAWLMPRTIDEAALEQALRAAFESRFEMDPGAARVPDEALASLAAVRAFGTERADVSLVNDSLGVDGSFAARWAPVESGALFAKPGAPLALEIRLLTGRRSDAVWMLGASATLHDAAPYVRWNPRAGGVLAVVLVLLILPVVRGWGSVVVVLDYDKMRGAQGFFSIELSRRPGRAKQEKKGGSARSRVARYQRRARPWARFTRHMVGRETRMGWLPARTWYVAVHGLLQDATSHEVIGNYLEEKKVKVSRGDSTQVVFDFRRKAAPIEVQLYAEEGKAVPQARVAVLGVRDSLRFAKDGTTTMFLTVGKHTLLIGVEDRVYERAVEVRELVGQTVGVQVDRDDVALFTGCKDAVDPYLQGDLAAASRTLERSGKSQAAALIRAAHHRMRGEAEESARWLEKAGRFAEAAELTKQSPEPKRSADLYEKAGDFHQAAEEHARAGDPLQAARAYEAAFDYAAAIDAYRNAGAKEKALELLEKTGRFFEAGVLALELGESDRALRLFQQVGPRESEYADACDALAKLFVERRAFDLAVEKASEALEARGGDDAPLEAQEALANLMERAGQPERALSVWENIRKRDFQYAGVGEKVDELRATVAEARRTSAASSAATAHNAVPAAARDARYEILGEIGRGGMGVVLKARDTRLGRVVALKRMPENLKNNPTAVQLFLREARAAAALSHPNIVTLFDADQEADGSYYLTMELLEGFGLDSVLQKRGKLTPRDAVRIGVQIAKGLQFAHEKGVVHRDIKTANLFFTRDRVLKIMDFGLAKMSEEVRKAATVIGGTPYYMAPEQAVGDKVDHRADLYALGVTLFELVTGNVPFRDGDILHHHRHTPAPDLRTLEPDVPEPLAPLVLKLMEKTPDQRPATTAEVSRALEQILAQIGEGATTRATVQS